MIIQYRHSEAAIQVKPKAGRGAPAFVPRTHLTLKDQVGAGLQQRFGPPFLYDGDLARGGEDEI